MTATILVIALRIAAIAAVIGAIVARIRSLRRKGPVEGGGQMDGREIE